jgi:serine/threonine protein kinase
MDPNLLIALANHQNKETFYDNKIDIWSIGAVCYEMLTGQTVYEAQSLDDLIKKAHKGSINLPTNLSSEAINFLEKMLQFSPSNRLSAVELSKLPFLTKNVKSFKIIPQKGTLKVNDIKNIKEGNVIKNQQQPGLNPYAPNIIKNQQQPPNQMNEINPNEGNVIKNQPQPPNQMNEINSKEGDATKNQPQPPNQMNEINPKEDDATKNQPQPPYQINELNPKEGDATKNQQPPPNQMNELNPKKGYATKSQQQPPNQMNPQNLNASLISISNNLFTNPYINNNTILHENAKPITSPPKHSPQNTQPIYQNPYYLQFRKDPYEYDNMAMPSYNNNLLINNQFNQGIGIGSPDPNAQNNQKNNCFIF